MDWRGVHSTRPAERRQCRSADGRVWLSRHVESFAEQTVLSSTGPSRQLVGGGGPGRRVGLEVLNKSGIVLTCAIWEAYVKTSPQHGPAGALHAWAERSHGVLLMTVPSSAVTIEAIVKQGGAPVTAKHEFNREVRVTALLTLALLAALTFGIIVLAGGDSIPGTLIVAASVIGLARQIPVINKLCRQTPPSPPHDKPTG